MDNEGFPAYQWSKFVNGDRGEQYVVRANDLNTFKARLQEVKDWLKLDGTPTAQPEVTDAAHFCKLHDKQMKERTWPNGGVYYDHRQKFGEEWKQCKGEGWS